jgi:hypothetical protein
MALCAFANRQIFATSFRQFNVPGMIAMRAQLTLCRRAQEPSCRSTS